MQGDTRPAWMQVRQKPDVDVWKIAVGVAAGILAAGAIAFLARAWMVNQAVGEFNKAIATITRETHQQTVRERERQERARAAALEQEALRRAAEADRQRASEAAIKQAQDLRFAKDDAWKRFYQKPALCDQAEGQAFIDCANHHIRARRQFEELWAAGKL